MKHGVMACHSYSGCVLEVRRSGGQEVRAERHVLEAFWRNVCLEVQLVSDSGQKKLNAAKLNSFNMLMDWTVRVPNNGQCKDEEEPGTHAARSKLS